MPVTFQVDDASGAVLTTANGIVSYADLVEHIETKKGRDLMTRVELFDARDIMLDLSLSELHGIAEKTKEALGGKKPALVAVVTNSAFVYGLARAYAAISRDDNPRFQIFQNVQEARACVLGTRK